MQWNFIHGIYKYLNFKLLLKFVKIKMEFISYYKLKIKHMNIKFNKSRIVRT